MFSQFASCFTGQPVRKRTPVLSIATTRAASGLAVSFRSTGVEIVSACVSVCPKIENDETVCIGSAKNFVFSS